MEISRKLAEGVGAWLQYQYACNNSDLFCEQFLIEPIGRILSSLTTERVIAEYRHPVFAPMKIGQGRRPAVDFVVCDPFPRVKYAIESKWIGKTKPSVQSVVWDLIRLEQIAFSDGADCFFVLGGQKRSIDAYLCSKAFAGPPELVPPKPVLQANKNYKYQLDLTADVIHRRKMLKVLLGPYQDHPFPHKIHTRRTNPFPQECKASQYQIYVWNVTAKPKRAIFYPKNSKHYSQRT